MSLKIANKWFERQKINDDITLLWEPHVHPWLRCNIWHVKGRDRDLLIDTGMGIASLKEAAEDLFQKPLTVVVTHAHGDHMGSAHEFDNCSCHPHEADLIRNAVDSMPLRWSDWDKDELEGMNLPENSGDYVIDALPKAGFDIKGFTMKPAKPSQLIDEGSRIDLGNRNFEVLHLPGHSPGSIGLWEASTGTFFSGDAIYDGISLLDEIPGANIGQYLKTMERLMELPVNIVHGGHQNSFDRKRLIAIAKNYIASRRVKSIQV